MQLTAIAVRIQCHREEDLYIDRYTFFNSRVLHLMFNESVPRSKVTLPRQYRLHKLPINRANKQNAPLCP